MNKSLAKIGKKLIKEKLALCSAKEQEKFKHLYIKKYQDNPTVYDVADCMDDDCISTALTQIENTLKKRGL